MKKIELTQEEEDKLRESLKGFIPRRRGVIFKRCHSCGGMIVKSSGGVIIEFCAKCNKPYRDQIIG